MKHLIIPVFLAVLFSTAFVCSADTIKQFKPIKINAAKMIKQFKPVTFVRIKKNIKTSFILHPVIPAAKVKPSGPDPKAGIDLADMIDDTDLLEDLASICGWDPHLIFQDKSAGNVFYYLPGGFFLVHDEKKGYGLNVQYNHLKDPDKPSVMLTAELAAPHHKGDILVLKNILKQAFDLKASDKLILKSISGIGASADMKEITAGLMIDPDNISISLPSHLKKSFRLTLALNQDETEEILAQITREGLSGSLNVKVGDVSVPVPIHIQYLNFSGSRVGGFTQWVENKPVGVIENITDFPLELSSINCYRIKSGRLERLSKKLKPVTLFPGQKKPFRLASINKIFGNNVMLAWMGTSLDSNCSDCLKKIDKKVRKGVAAAPSTHIKFEAIPDVFSDFDIYKIIVQVQSPYFNCDAGKVLTREIELTEENNIKQDLLIYTLENKGPEPLLYRYRLKLITKEGRSVSEQNWHDSRTISQFFGANLLEPLMENNKDSQ